MKKYLYIFLALLVSALPAFAEGELESGDLFSDLVLPRPAQESQADYLGLKPGDKDFSIKDIPSELVLVEFFSMYCPHCQHEAPTVNKLYDRIKEKKLAEKIKIIGIGVGNSSYEVGIFQKKFDVPFPLFDDEFFKWHKDVGQVGTPYFVLVRNEGGVAKVVFSHLGRIDTADHFLGKITKHL